MDCPPLFFYNTGYPVVSGKERFGGLFNFNLKKVEVIEGLTFQGKKCGFLKKPEYLFIGR